MVRLVEESAAAARPAASRQTMGAKRGMRVLVTARSPDRWLQAL